MAEQDEASLQFPLPEAIFGFHAQQSCEKLLKAFASANNVMYPFTHSLEKLIDLVELAGDRLPTLSYDLLKLDPFAVTFRYDVGGSLDAADQADIKKAVQELREFVVRRVLAIEATP